MAAKSGKWGIVMVGGSIINEFTDWDYQYGEAVQTYASRAGGGAEKTEAGVESGSGTIRCLFDPTDAVTASLLKTGSLVYLYLAHTHTINATASPPTVYGIMHHGYARIGNLSYSVSRSGELQSVSIEFTQDGTWQHPNQWEYQSKLHLIDSHSPTEAPHTVNPPQFS